MTRSLTAAVTAWSLAAFIGGCSALSAQADATRYFVVTPSAASEPKPVLGFDRSVGIGPVTVPDHLEDSLVTRLADQEIFISDTDRWSEPLHESIQHVLRQDLMTLLGTERIQLYPWGPSAPPDLAVAVEVLQFEREVSGTAAVTVHWSIQRGSDRAPLLTEETSIREPIRGNDSRDAAAALMEDGEYIDRLEELDNQHWQSKPLTKVRRDAAGKPIPGKHGPLIWDEADNLIAGFGHGVHPTMMALAGRLVGEGMSWDDIYAELMRRLAESAGGSPQHPRHQRWKGMIADRRKEVTGFVKDAFKMEKAKKGVFNRASHLDTPGSGPGPKATKADPEAKTSTDEDHVFGGAKASEGRKHEKAAEEPKAKPRAWVQLLQRNKTGFLTNEHNILVALTHAPPVADMLAYDAFRCQYMLMRRPPWALKGETFPRQWSDNDDANCAIWLQKEGLQSKPRQIRATVMCAGARHTFNPLTDFLTGLTWDGIERVDTWLTEYLGADDSLIHREFGIRFLLSAVARAMKPGCKVDTMLVLEGEQGRKKSMALSALAGAEFFTDEIHDIGSKDASMQMAGVWIIELSELDAMSKPEVSRTKAWLSRTTDRFRPPWGRTVIDQPRGCVIVGSTNRDDYLRDDTGGRRFWPVMVGEIKLDRLIEDRAQIWAEAFARYQADEPWWISSEYMIRAAEKEQEERLEKDEAWGDLVEDYLTRNAAGVTIRGVIQDALGLDVNQWKRHEKAVASILRKMGWKRDRPLKSGKKTRLWTRSTK